MIVIPSSWIPRVAQSALDALEQDATTDDRKEVVFDKMSCFERVNGSPSDAAIKPKKWWRGESNFSACHVPAQIKEYR